MRRVLIVLLIALWPFNKAMAQTYAWTEFQVRFDKSSGYVVPELHLYGSNKKSAKMGMFGWGLATGGQNGNWGETIVGLSLFPKSSVQIDLGTGIEAARDPWRVMGSVWTGNKRAQLFSTLEDGGSGAWYLTTANLNLAIADEERGSPSIGIGFMARRFAGIGPRFEAGGPNGMVWVAHLYPDPEEHGGGTMLGMRWKF